MIYMIKATTSRERATYTKRVEREMIEDLLQSERDMPKEEGPTAAKSTSTVLCSRAQGASTHQMRNAV